MNLHKLTKILISISVIVTLFGGGYKLGEYNTSKKQFQRNTYSINNANPQENPKNLDFKLFWDTWDKVEKRFIDQEKLDPQKMFEGAIKGMVASLGDPYTFFLTSDENKQSKDNLGGKFQGIGAQLGLENNSIVVIAPLKKSPAMKVGILAGDIITKVDNKDTSPLTLTQVVDKIRGPKGTKVTLDILRNKSKEMQFTITRDEIHVDSVELEYEKDIAIIKISQFGDDTNSLWDKYATEVSKKYNNKEIKGLILDLRDDPGGYLQSATYIASDFLPYNKLIVKQEYSDKSSETYMVNRQGKLLDIPLVVIINGGSASASEILSGAIRDYGRAKLIGEKTFGKGSVQEALDLYGGAGLHVTVAKWILPKGDWINGKGIKPDILIKNEVKEGNTLTKKDDKQLIEAINLLSK